jgi:hypothetical protein
MILILSSLLLFFCTQNCSTVEIEQLIWLRGFDNCTNYIFILNNIFIEGHAFVELQNNFTSLVISTSAKPVAFQKNDFRKNLVCQTLSFIFSDAIANTRLIQTVSDASLSLKAINPSNPKRPNGTIQILPRFVFLFGPKKVFSQTIEDVKNDVFAPLWKHPFHSKIFLIKGVLIPPNHSYSFSKLEISEIFFICHLCRQWDKRRDLLPHSLTFKIAFSLADDAKTSFKQIFDSKDHEIAQNGKNITWCIPPFMKVIPRNQRLIAFQSIRSSSELLQMAPHIDELVLSIIMESISVASQVLPVPDLDYPWVYTVRGWSIAHHQTILDLEGFSFITCDGIYQSLSYGAYLKPFQTEVWAALAFSIASSIFLLVGLVNSLKVYGKWHGLPRDEFGIQSVLFTLIALLLETEIFIGSIGKSKHFRLFMFTWLFASLILSTAYRGDNISTVIVPSTSQKLFEKFGQLQGFRLYTEELHSRAEEGHPPAQNRRSMLGYAFQVYVMNRYGTDVMKKVEKGYNVTVTESFQNPTLLKVVSAEDLKVLSLYKNIIPVDAAGKNGLQIARSHTQNCSKTAYVAHDSVTNDLLLALQTSPERTFYMGKESLFSLPNTLTFSKSGGDHLSRRADAVVRSGIYNHWNRLIQYKKKLSEKRKVVLQNTPNNDEVTISLQSNIVTLFIILLALLTLSFIVFCLEVNTAYLFTE